MTKLAPGDLTAREAMKKLKVSRNTLYTWVKKGYFPNAKRFGARQLIITEGDIKSLRDRVAKPVATTT